MPDMALILEAETRGILPADKKPLLVEARKRGLIPQVSDQNRIASSEGTPPEGLWGKLVERGTGAVKDITKLDHVDEFIEYFFKRSQLKQRLLILNRVPSLWRHSCPIVEVAGVNEDNIISVSPMIIEPMNMDKESQGPYKIS